MPNNADKEKLQKLGVSSLLDLALLIPKSYENTYINQSPILNQYNTLHVKVLRSNWGPKALSLKLFSETWDEEIHGVIFSAKPYHRSLFKVGASLHVRGKIEWNQGKLSIIQPIVISQINTIVPKYKTTLQNRTVIALIKKYLSDESLKKEGLSEEEINILLSLHFPTPTQTIEFEKSGLSAKALHVVKFLEIYNYIKVLSKKKVDFKAKNILNSDESDFIQSLPFELTNDQKNAITDIKRDFNSIKSARRIVMGDVGSGKTIVILASVMMAYPRRAVLMAPTTILAKQLFEEAQKFLPKQVKSLLLVSKTSKKEDLNQYDFIIGTHALLHRKLPDFDLVMVDEQHRFGTKQRELINQLSIEEGKHPHFLQFSATPIPRTMSMIQSSLVNFSFIKETPFEKDIDTKIIRKADFKNLTEHIKEEMKEGRQIIVIYPLVEVSDVIEYQSIEESRAYWEKNYENVFVTYGADKNKEEILENFRDEGSILIATTLVEVGISLPNLSTIVIVGAERLGLATLHQLRGRVSRNGLKGYCFLYTNQNQSERLSEFSKTDNGFDIAELDLRYRKGGDVLGGIRQSGQKFEFYDMEEEILIEAKKRLGKL
ncbi:ATP-dependent DNA helicase RecG [Sulfurospirillum arcachonense]|uniref:ATP-dependent DNA helicase RecG n=1 Tax=Sulfurospirillum arcachonense TaxID=57666 RepID=UPI00046A2A05|nr:ATP-dependent DNA helicase RecG [Sulfurospirillum arcachonense]